MANSSHMEHTTPTRVASSCTMSRTPLEASEKGGEAEMQLVGSAGVIQRRRMQPSRALSEDLTSTHKCLMRAVIPGTKQLQALAQVPPDAGSVTARVWGTVASARAEYWLCMQCRATNVNSLATCVRCERPREALTSFASTEEIAAIHANAMSCSYGRSLAFLQGKQQSEGPGVAAQPGSAAYCNAVFAQVQNEAFNGKGGSSVKDIQPKVEEGVIRFDGWLALTTNGAARIWEREQVRACIAREDTEALTSEYIMAHTRTIRVAGNRLVQVAHIVAAVANFPLWGEPVLWRCWVLDLTFASMLLSAGDAERGLVAAHPA